MTSARRVRGPCALVFVGIATGACGAPPLSPAPVTPPALTQSHSARSAGKRPPSQPSPLAVAQSTHEYPGPQVGQTASVKAADPVSAVEAFATAYINWDAGTVAHDMGTLAAESVGQARSAMQLAAVQTGRDYELARAGVANRGIVEAIAPVTARSDQYAVVTLERTTATNATAYAGLAAAWHVAVATVTRLGPSRWVVSGWQPEN